MLKAYKECGIAVPQDMALTGHSGIPFAQLVP